MFSLRRFLVGSNLWVGLAAGAFALSSFKYIGSVFSVSYAVFVCFSTASAYSYMRLVRLGKKRVSQPTEAWLWFEKNFYLASGLSVVFTLLGSFFMLNCFEFMPWYWLLPCGIIALIYPITFPDTFHSFSSVRSIPGAKLLLIALCWVYVVYVVPMLIEGRSFSIVEFFEILLRVVFIAGLTIPFDIRDAATDEKKMQTLPQVLGSRGALEWSLVSVTFFQIWILFKLLFIGNSFEETFAWLIGLELAYWILKGVSTNPVDKYIAFWVEGIPIYILISLALSKGLLPI